MIRSSPICKDAVFHGLTLLMMQNISMPGHGDGKTAEGKTGISDIESCA
jgi:hypothetical protein